LSVPRELVSKDSAAGDSEMIQLAKKDLLSLGTRSVSSSSFKPNSAAPTLVDFHPLDRGIDPMETSMMHSLHQEGPLAVVTPLPLIVLIIYSGMSNGQLQKNKVILSIIV